MWNLNSLQLFILIIYNNKESGFADVLDGEGHSNSKF